MVQMVEKALTSLPQGQFVRVRSEKGNLQRRHAGTGCRWALHTPDWAIDVVGGSGGSEWLAAVVVVVIVRCCSAVLLLG